MGSNTEIADYGCGPGLYATKMAQRGAIVTGIDFSENSISYAKKLAAALRDYGMVQHTMWIED